MRAALTPVRISSVGLPRRVRHRLADGNSPAPQGSSMRMRHGRGEIALTPGATLSMKTRFGGPLVAQTSRGRLAQPCEAGSRPGRKCLQMRPFGELRRRPSLCPTRPVTPEVAGSSPVAPVSRKCLQTGMSCCLNRTRASLRGRNPWPKRSARNTCKHGLSRMSLCAGRTNAKAHRIDAATLTEVRRLKLLSERRGRACAEAAGSRRSARSRRARRPGRAAGRGARRGRTMIASGLD